MPVVIHPDDYAKWLDVQNVDGKESVQMLTMAADDYFVFEPTTIERNAPPPKPKAQLTLF
jgi:putative SOS response-associated peptidase YedK